jgi:hypothetical protein
MSRHLNAAFPNAGSAPFGGLNVILLGDFHQLDPITDRALYLEDHKVRSETKLSADHMAGHALYRQFEHTVLLSQQVRVKDPVWVDFLRAIREGRCSDNHIRMLESLVLSVCVILHCDRV